MADNDTTTETTAINWALDAWNFMLSAPSENPQFLAEARAAYDAANEISWAERNASLQERIESTAGHTRKNLQDALNRSDQTLLDWARENYLPEHDAFLAAAKADYDSIHGEGAWDKHVEEKTLELGENAEGWNGRDFNPLTWVGAMDSDSDKLAAYDPNAELANWGYIHMASQQGALDWSKVHNVDARLDGSVFKRLDGQNPVSDETMYNRNTEFGNAFLNAAEVLYNERTHITREATWAEEVAVNGWDEATAARELAKYAESEVHWFENNLASMGKTASFATDKAQVALLYLTTMNSFTESTWGDLGAAVWRGAVDPTFIAAGATSIATAGTGSAAAFGARMAAQVTARQAVQKIITAGVTGAMTGAVEGLVSETAMETIQQGMQISHEIRESYDLNAIAMRGAMGTLMGAGMGAGFGAVGRTAVEVIPFARIADNLRSRLPRTVPGSTQPLPESAAMASFTGLLARAADIQARAKETGADIADADAASMRETLEEMNAPFEQGGFNDHELGGVTAAYTELTDAINTTRTQIEIDRSTAPDIDTSAPAAPEVSQARTDDAASNVTPINPTPVRGAGFGPMQMPGLPGMPPRDIAAAPFNEMGTRGPQPTRAPADAPGAGGKPTTKLTAKSDEYQNIIARIQTAETKMRTDDPRAAQLNYDRAINRILKDADNTGFAPATLAALKKRVNKSIDQVSGVESTAPSKPSKPVTDASAAPANPAPQAKPDADTGTGAGAKANNGTDNTGITLHTDPKSWANNLDARFLKDGYEAAAASPRLADVGQIDPNLGFRRIRKKVDPSMDRATDSVMGDVKTKNGKDDYGNNVDKIVGGVYRKLDQFQAGFEDGTQKLINEIIAANGDPKLVKQAIDAYTVTLDKMDAATDAIADKDLGRAGTTLRNSTRRDYAGSLSSQKNAPNITAIQKIAIQEKIIDARLLAQELEAMALQPDGNKLIEGFLQGVAQRVNRSGAQLQQYDTLIASGWEAHVGKRNGVPKKLGANKKPIKDPDPANDGPLYLIGHTVMRETNRLGYDLAEGTQAYTVGVHMLRDAKDPNIENKGTAIMQHIIKSFHESTQPNETRIDDVAKRIADGIKNNQFHDLLYYLQRDAWMVEKDHTNVFQGQFENILIKTREALEANGELTAYELGALKRLQVEANQILNDNPAGQLTNAERRIFENAHDGKPITTRELRKRVARADAATDLNGGRYYNALDGNRSDASRGVIAANFNRWVYDWIIDGYILLKDFDADATFKHREENPTEWRYQITEDSNKWNGNWRLGSPLSIEGWKRNLGTFGRVYERWLTPVGAGLGTLKYAPDNTPLLNTRVGKYLRTPVATRTIRVASHLGWAGGLYATGGWLLTSPLTPFGAAYQITGAAASAQNMVFENGYDWGYLASNDGSSARQNDETSTIEKLEDGGTVEAVLAGTPFNLKREDLSFWGDAREDFDATVEAIRTRAAKLIDDNKETDPAKASKLATFQHFVTEGLGADHKHFDAVVSYLMANNLDPREAANRNTAVTFAAERAARVEAINAGLTTWLAANGSTFYKEQNAGIQEQMRGKMVEALLATDQSAAFWSSTDAADIQKANALRATAMQNVDAAFRKFDKDGNGKITADEVARATGGDGSKITDTLSAGAARLPTSLSETKIAAANVFNTITDHNGDGYSFFVDTDIGRSISGGVQSAWRGATAMVGANSETRGGRQINNALLAFGGALFAPWALSKIPGFSWLNGRFTRTIVMFGAFFMAWKYLNGGGFSKLGIPGLDGRVGDEDEGGTTEGTNQGGGKHLSGEGFKITAQSHDGNLPRIITIEGDFDGDENTIETINFFDTDGDELYAAQMVNADGSVSWASNDTLRPDRLAGALKFAPDEVMAKGTLREGVEIKVEAHEHDAAGKPVSFKLDMPGGPYILDHKLDDILDDQKLDTLERIDII